MQLKFKYENVKFFSLAIIRGVRHLNQLKMQNDHKYLKKGNEAHKKIQNRWTFIHDLFSDMTLKKKFFYTLSHSDLCRSDDDDDDDDKGNDGDD